MMHCVMMSALFIFLSLLVSSCERKKIASVQGPWHRVLSEQLDSIVQAVEQDPAAMPQNLSDTGLFTSLEPLSTQAGLIPYGVNLAFWSDYAVKQR